ncbi:alpha/beta hydrolase [Pseudonocardia sp. CA-107938]|uniref:alpha/beta hydrolase n=1 Tax=Pseudonocardia sp. CA-107938 TaxID=3240021 RepID=UPI003D8EE635
MEQTSARRMGQVIAALCAAALSGALTACAPMAVGAPAAIGLSPPGLDRYYSQTLAWGGCDGLATNPDEQKLYANPALQCARLEVPLDYRAPNGRTAQVAVLRHVTDNPARIGSLVVNPGGPGGSGVELAAGLSTVLAHFPFDVVGFDPRGVGASTPKLDCLTAAEEAALAGSTGGAAAAKATTVAQIEEQERAFGELCAQRSGGVDVLANAGTRDVARDLDVLRAVLGDRQLTYLGFSYGTSIGSTYAEMFPTKVRAMVLDGAIDPAQSTADQDVAQAAGQQAAFDAYAADCAKAASCPLGTDPADATAVFQKLTRPLLTKPVPAGPGHTLSYESAVTAATGSLYDPSGWPALTAGLTELKAGTGERLRAIAGQVPDQEAMLAVNCADNDRFTDRAAVAARDERMLKAHPFADPGTPPGVAALGLCDLWPAPPSGERHVPDVDGLPTVLVISTTVDPATPYAAGVALADELDARLLTYEGVQHAAFLKGSACINAIGSQYLVTLELPAEGTRCSAQTEGSK